MKWITEVQQEYNRKKQIEYINNFNRNIMENQVPRRIRLDLNTPAELAIYEAMGEVEKLPADTRLTEAVILLEQAKNKVADYVDGVVSDGNGNVKAD